MRNLRNLSKLSYWSATYALGDKDSKKICNNTWLERQSDNSIAVKHWRTNIITFHTNGDIVIDTCGYWTVTTKERINMILENIYVGSGQYGPILSYKGTEYEYFDGIKIDANGNVNSVKSHPPLVRYLKSVLDIVVDSLEEAYETIKTLDNNKLWKIWQKCTSTRSMIAQVCPIEFLPLTINSDDRRKDDWISVVMARYDGRPVN
jgi:hypothetical protein